MGAKAVGATGQVNSMTGFAGARGASDGYSWTWDLRSVNGRGLDLRLRLPDWIEGLESDVRKALQARLARGNVTLSLRITADDTTELPQIDATRLGAMLSLLREVEVQAEASGMPLAPMRATDIASMRGILDTTVADTDTTALKSTLMADVEPLIDAFVAARAQEGAALAALLNEQVDRIAGLSADARAEAAKRPDAVRDALQKALERILSADERLDEARLTQELALIAVKQDVTEELDRLDAHVATARELISQGSPIGRKLEFLTQEFNREANTLCSKAQAAELTAIGLDLKAVIDQMREQVQNVE